VQYQQAMRLLKGIDQKLSQPVGPAGQYWCLKVAKPLCEGTLMTRTKCVSHDFVFPEIRVMHDRRSVNAEQSLHPAAFVCSCVPVCSCHGTECSFPWMNCMWLNVRWIVASAGQRGAGALEEGANRTGLSPLAVPATGA
jgi:hypothetical protein